MEFEFTASCTTRVDYDEKTMISTLIDSALQLEFGEGLDATKYFDKTGRPNASGTKILTDVFVQGLIGNIHNAHQTGIRDSAEHLRYAIAELEKLFVLYPKIESQQERDEREKFNDA